MDFDTFLATSKQAHNSVIAGGPKCGKTTMAIHIAKQLFKNNVKHGIVITNKPEEYQCLENVHIYTEYDSTHLCELVTRQKEQHKIEQEMMNIKHIERDYALFILDIPIDVSLLNCDKMFRTLIMNPNGFRVSSIVVSRYILDFTPPIRTSLGNILQFQDETFKETDIKKRYDELCVGTMSLNKYDALCMLDCFKSNEWVVYNCRQHSV